MDSMSIDPRLQRGMALAKAQGSKIRLVAGTTYVVPSATHSHGAYVVHLTERTTSCSCPDFQDHNGPVGEVGHADHELETHKCKHIYAVLIIRKEIALPSGASIVTEQKVRINYPRDHRANDLAGVDLYRVGPRLISELVGGLPLASTEGRRRGRPRAQVRDIAQGVLLRTFYERTLRESVEAMETSQERGWWSGKKPLHFTTVCEHLGNPEMLPVFQTLVNESAKPLVTLERNFAIDSTGFGTTTYQPSWFNSKHGKSTQRTEARKHRWLKVHLCTGTATHVVTAVHVTENHGVGTGDAPNLKELVVRTVKNGFIAEKITADAAYISTENLRIIEETANAVPFIAFRSNITGSSSPILARHLHKFAAEGQAWWDEFHDRSNVESTIFMLKKRWGETVASRRPLAQVLELLCRVICHNVACIIQTSHELHIAPSFWAPTGATNATPALTTASGEADETADDDDDPNGTVVH